MRYQSTRDKTKRVSASGAILQGISSEGGLFVPEKLPELSVQRLEKMVGQDYIQRAQGILADFLSDFSQEEIARCLQNAYGSGSFSSAKIAPLSRLGQDAYLLELWHGPTCAFKDMALQLLPQLMAASVEKSGGKEEIVILVATSGDTGKAALEGFRDVPGIRIVVFYPEEGVSPLQKLQMATQEGENVFVAAIQGNFDDAQTGVKRLFTDREVLEKLQAKNQIFSSANSINWGRLLPQIVYYVSAYCDLVQEEQIALGDPVNICVPTGNFGNILAAYYAKRMGLPVQKLICASNRNNVLADFIATGAYDRNRPFYATTSPSMDILVSSNLERLLFDLMDEDDAKIHDLMRRLETEGRYIVSPQVLLRLQADFAGGFCDEAQTADAIRRIYDRYSYLCDPHTAVAVSVYEQYRAKSADDTKTILVSTASPFKFPHSVLSALGEDPAGLDEFQIAERLERISGRSMPKQLSDLREKPIRFTECFAKDQMDRALERIL